ncbi:MAG: hypothetical protein A2148_06040 [Chloroflexi bacterium RBG_16_68_14]|nr:MAG: hypothetical protein A2148_06040 [Chloroflexi bacterium RBG_16_68_14]
MGAEAGQQHDQRAGEERAQEDGILQERRQEHRQIAVGLEEVLGETEGLLRQPTEAAEEALQRPDGEEPEDEEHGGDGDDPGQLSRAPARPRCGGGTLLLVRGLHLAALPASPRAG